jgi:hypothetical protein
MLEISPLLRVLFFKNFIKSAQAGLKRESMTQEKRRSDRFDTLHLSCVQVDKDDSVIFERVRRTYDGPLTMANDLTVINVTKDHMEVREATINHEAWAQGTSNEWDTAPRSETKDSLISDWLKKGSITDLVPPPKIQ